MSNKYKNKYYKEDKQMNQNNNVNNITSNNTIVNSNNEEQKDFINISVADDNKSGLTINNDSVIILDNSDSNENVNEDENKNLENNNNEEESKDSEKSNEEENKDLNNNSDVENDSEDLKTDSNDSKEIIEIKKGVIKNCVALNIRQEPNLKSEIIGTLYDTDEVDININESTNKFYNVSNDKYSGYCLKDYIRLK